MTLKPESALRKDLISAHGIVLQHRHFAFIAGIIKKMSGDGFDLRTQRNVAEHFAFHLADTNGRFDRERFLAACGVRS